MRRAGLLAVVAVVGVLRAGTARADDEIVKGSVVKVEHQEIYVSLGTKQGVVDGAAIRLKRTIRLRHPVTRAPVEDWVPVGSATVTQAGAGLSRAVIGELIDDVKVGDFVESLIERPDVRAPTTTAPAPEAPAPPAPAGPPVDREAVEILGIFAAHTGATLEARIAGWERYLSTHGESRYTEAIRRDLDTLRGLRDQQRPAAAGASNEDVGTVRHSARAAAYAGAPLPLVFVLDNPERVASAFLHYRPRDARTYRRLLLVREHEIYLRGIIPGEAITTPGFDYFVEVSTPAGRSGLAIGSPTQPIRIEVARPPLIDQFGAAPGKSSVKLAIDYLDFATFDRRPGDHTDRMTTANVDFTYRLASAVQSIGVGYGVYAGAGGFADQTWSEGNPFPRSGFHFGYADLELGGKVERVPLSLGGKVIAGVGKEGFGMGVEGRFRIGGRDATNLQIAARTIEQVGTLTDIRFGARPAQNLLIGVSVGATNQPNQGDIGVKLGTELEWIGFRNVSVILRGSWQGRSVDHGGLGGGGGLGVYW
ncbi:MAG: hypothetical protein H0T42_08665 [Deltaproteobacteria bacterium]|nr:hypothetical protein [Deltaproteobacteria bacterium]